jgi:hypothetical protein
VRNNLFRKIARIFKGKWNPDYIQIGILLAIFIQAFIFIWQTATIKNHFAIEQRPIIIVAGIETNVPVNENLQQNIGAGDEFIITIKYQNIGKSSAYVDYVRVKIFYGFFLRNGNNLCFGIKDLAGQHQNKLLSLDKEVPVGNPEMFRESIVLPNQILQYQTMDDAIELMNNIRAYTSSREAPIFVECEVRYSTIDRSEDYWYNCIYELQWPSAKHITIYSMMIKSNMKDEPLHLTYAGLLRIVAERQKIRNVIDALDNGGKNLDQILNCEGVKR